MSTPALRRYIESQGGSVQDTHDGLAVTFPEPARASAREVEAAVERAREFGTRVLPVWRERGPGWFVAESLRQHPGWVYLCQIDMTTGQPIRCECIAGATGTTPVCHHLGAAIRDWRKDVGYEANGAAVLADWKATLAAINERRTAPQEEEWT